MRFVIGDIHGMKGMLERLLEKIFKYDPKELIFLGDYIDKGPDSVGIIEILMGLPEDIKTTFLMGNHEYVLLDYLAGNTDRKEFLLNYGGKQFLSEDIGGLKEKHLDFLKGLKHYYLPAEAPFVCVHAGLLEDFDLEKGLYNLEKLVFLRKEFTESSFLYKNRKIIFGHTASSKPYIDDYKIGLDTGAVYTLEGKEGCLSAFEIDTQFFIDHSGKIVNLKNMEGDGDED